MERNSTNVNGRVALSQQGAAGAQAELFLPSSKVMMTVAAWIRFLSLAQCALRDRCRLGFGRMNLILSLSSDSSVVSWAVRNLVEE